MSKTIDTGTPIFGALNEELGLPDFEVHDFDVHAFDFLRAEDAADSASSTAAQDAPAPGSSVQVSPAEGSAATPEQGEGKRRQRG